MSSEKKDNAAALFAVAGVAILVLTTVSYCKKRGEVPIGPLPTPSAVVSTR